jgi:hypothetical protein
MLAAIIIGLLLAPQKVATLECTNIATVETQPVEGPDGRSAVLKVSTEDNHSKNEHLCSAHFELLVGPRAASGTVELGTFEAEYGRSLTLQLAGFSQDGERILGIITEGGKYPSAALFDYQIGLGPPKLIDLRPQLTFMFGRVCDARYSIIGITARGEIVVKVAGDEKGPAPCKGAEWVFDEQKQRPYQRGVRLRVIELYKPAAK